MRFHEEQIIDALNRRGPRHQGTLCAILYIHRNRFGKPLRYYVYKLNRRKNGLEKWLPAQRITFDKKEARS